MGRRLSGTLQSRWRPSHRATASETFGVGDFLVHDAIGKLLRVLVVDAIHFWSPCAMTSALISSARRVAALSVRNRVGGPGRKYYDAALSRMPHGAPPDIGSST